MTVEAIVNDGSGHAMAYGGTPGPARVGNHLDAHCGGDDVYQRYRRADARPGEEGNFWVWCFECKDIYATYEELKAKGVDFTKAPKKEFYGIEALFKDDSGNWFSLGQKP